MKADPSERHNIAAQHSELVEKMSTQLGGAEATRAQRGSGRTTQPRPLDPSVASEGEAKGEGAVPAAAAEGDEGA